MDILKIEGTSQYPTVVLDKSSGRFEFSGNSLPEDAIKFYSPIITWIEDYVAEPNPETVVRFKLAYYNTPSSKQIFQILKRFENLSASGYKVEIRWLYNEDDQDIKDSGRDLAGHLKLPFQFESCKE
ncbi:MAG: DUF1987 domain-containing protein [Bacteroidales bacterium]|nr:DUF1987 domain-containing protein [Bacteroidales bacterium]